jgi:hypothetical protein
MLDFLIDNIYVVVGGHIFQQSVGIPMGMNCALLLADLFLYSYEVEFIQKLLREKKKYLAVVFNSTFRYIDGVLSINSNHFHSYVNSIYPNKIETKDTTECSTSASYLDVLLKLDTNGKLTTQLYMINGTISISPSSTSLTYVAILQPHLRMVCIYRSLFVMQELCLHTIIFYFQAIY